MPQLKTHDDDSPFDEKGILKDGRSFRVSMMMQDGTQKVTADRVKRVVQRDPAGHEISTYYEQEENEDAAMQRLEDARVKAEAFSSAARAQYIKDQENAWRTTDASSETGVGSHQSHGPFEGSACMTNAREPGVYTKGADGTLTCTATSKKDAAAIKDRAYRQMCEDKQNAWKS